MRSVPASGLWSALAVVTLLHVSPPADAAPRLHGVRFEGCVVDDALRPLAGRSVAAIALDGRVLASGRTDASGDFSVRVPAASVFRIRLGGDVPLPPVLRSSQQDAWMSWCLREGGD